MIKPFLSSSDLKLIAFTTMVVDHVGVVFFPEERIFRIIGRIAFPIFAFLIAEGHLKTHNEGAYLVRLFLFAIITQVPHVLINELVGNAVTLNALFTLTAGLLALIIFKKYPIPIATPLIVGLCVISEYASFDYGSYGVLTVLMSAVVLSPYRMVGVLLLLLLPLARVPDLSHASIFTDTAPLGMFALMSVPIVLLYNGTIGMKMPRKALYWFYPGHLLVLYLLGLLLL